MTDKPVPINRRTADRLAAIEAARAKLTAKLAAAPDDRRADGWRQRVAEYDASLANIAATGRERQKGSAGAGVDVPAAELKGGGR